MSANTYPTSMAQPDSLARELPPVRRMAGPGRRWAVWACTCPVCGREYVLHVERKRPEFRGVAFACTNGCAPEDVQAALEARGIWRPAGPKSRAPERITGPKLGPGWGAVRATSVFEDLAARLRRK
jgi:hypothetical protein